MITDNTTETCWRHCIDCDVKWHGEPECWCCGRVVMRRNWSPAIIQGGMVVIRPLSVSAS